MTTTSDLFDQDLLGEMIAAGYVRVLDQHIRDQYDVTCVFDDRDRVVKETR